MRSAPFDPGTSLWCSASAAFAASMSRTAADAPTALVKCGPDPATVMAKTMGRSRSTIAPRSSSARILRHCLGLRASATASIRGPWPATRRASRSCRRARGPGWRHGAQVGRGRAAPRRRRRGRRRGGLGRGRRSAARDRDPPPQGQQTRRGARRAPGASRLRQAEARGIIDFRRGAYASAIGNLVSRARAASTSWAALGSRAFARAVPRCPRCV